jgi:hypothetical protein
MTRNKQRGKHYPVLFSSTYLCVRVIPLGICWLNAAVLFVGKFTDNDNYMF